MAKPARLASIGAFLPLVFSLLGIALAHGAAPTVALSKNPIIIFLCLIIASSCVMVAVPRAFSWDWETKYFGVSVFHLGSVALLGLVPFFCLVLYAQLPVAARICLLLVNVVLHAAWCHRFIRYYQKINGDDHFRRCLYQEDEDAVYYMQRGDKHLFEKHCKFNQIPEDRYFGTSLLLSFSLVPIMGTVKEVVGLPFVHSFLIIGALPISLMGAGLAIRGWLVFYFYPIQIRKITGKRVYVDMGGKPDIPPSRKRTTSESGKREYWL
jgi:hypothetical protein